MTGRALALAAFLIASASAAHAQSTYPVRPVRILVASSPGSAVDIVTRIIIQKMPEILGQQLVIDNRAGAGGNLGAEIAAHAAPDGYTLFMSSPAHVINASLAAKPTYDLVRDFAPISLLTSGAYVIVLNPRVQAKTVKELIALAKAQPGKLNFASAGNDVGANMGSHTLPLARLVGATGRVVAFEPTRWGYDKLLQNLALNPTLSTRVTALQTLLVRRPDERMPDELYSWPLGDTRDVHERHRGKLMSTAGAHVMTLDDALAGVADKVDFIKIDVDGHEKAVLEGARATLAAHAPMVMIELAPHVYADGEFETLLQLIRELGYQAVQMNTKRPLPHETVDLCRHIPRNGSINVLLSFER